MNHPHDLLAEYVDGALPEGERAVVESHVQGCSECQAEVGSATHARRALASLKDGPVPRGLGEAVMAAISNPTPARGTPHWYRAAGLAAAAAIVALLAITLPRLGSDNEAGTSLEAAAPAAGDAAPAQAPEELRVDEQDIDYTDEALLDLVAGERTAFAEADAVTTTQPREVLECLRTAFPPVRSRLPIHLIRARFRGTAAYIGVFDAPEGSGSPAQSAVAASVRDCRLLSYATRT